MKESVFNWEEYWSLFEQSEDGLPIITEIDPDSPRPLPEHLKGKCSELDELLERYEKEEVLA